MKRLVALFAALMLVSLPAVAQIPGGSEIAIGKTPVIGGTANLCLYVDSANKVGNQACASGGVTTFSAGTTGFTPNSATGGAITLAGTLIGANGGTGVANTGKTITLGGNLTTSGAFASTFTMTNTTSVTFPVSGTLAILGANSFTETQTITPATANTSALVLTGGTITAAANLFSGTRTWNNAGVTFTSMLLNITDTASNAASLLIDLQKAGVSQFKVDKSGNATITGALQGVSLTGSAVAVNANVTAVTGSGYGLLATQAGSSTDGGVFVSYGGTGPAVFDFLRTNAATTAASTTVASGDEIGAFDFYEANGTNYKRVGRLRYVADGVPSTISSPGRFEVLTTPSGSTTPALALTIDATKLATFVGSVAIGNTVNSVSPTSPNRTVTMVIGGTTYYLAAKTTND